MAADSAVEKRWSRIASWFQSPVRQMVAVGVALLLIANILFASFIFGDKTLLYTDIGADSLNIFYPNYVLRSEYLREYGLFSWAFEVGMGQNISPATGSLLLNPIVWFPKSAIAPGLVYQHLFYVVVAGLFFFRFFRDCRLAIESCFLGAVLLAFSAYMCMGSCWYFHAAEATAFTILLFCLSRAVLHKVPVFLAPGIAAVSLLGAFHLYLAAIFLCLVVPALLFVQRTDRKTFVQALFLLALAALIGVGLNAVNSIDGLFTILNSPRGRGPASVAPVLRSAPIFSPASGLHYATAILRAFANDLAGTGEKYRGDLNYLEAPMSYCGLVCLLLAPQAFIHRDSRQRIVCSGFIVFLVLPVIFPWFRHLFWAFQGEYYRALSLFGVLGMIAVAMLVLSRYCRGAPFNIPVLLVTTAILVAALFAPISELQNIVDPSLRRIVVALLISYCLLFCGGALLRCRRLFSWAIIGLAVVELVCFNRITINRPMVARHELSERVGYNDYTVEAVRDIKAADHGFFRLTKTFTSSPAMYQGLNDALVFGYYSTMSYSSFNNLNYIKFLIALDTIPAQSLALFTHWAIGLDGHPLALAFACEKYVLTKGPEEFQQLGQYEVVGQYGDATLLQNHACLPFGLPLQQWVREADFATLDGGQKENALLHAVILNDDQALLAPDLPRLEMSELKERMETASLPQTLSKLQARGLTLESFSESRIDGVIELDAPGIVVFQTPFDSGWHAFADDRPVKTLLVDAGLLGVALESGEHRVKLRYVPPFRATGALISALSAVLLGAWWWRRSAGFGRLGKTLPCQADYQVQ